MKRRELGWGAIAQFLNIGAGLLILPFVLRLLTATEVGLWFTFLALAGLAQLLELGFLPSIARAVAYVHAGAQELQAEGINKCGTRGPLNFLLLGDVVATARHVYRIVALLAAFVLLGPGTFYIYSITSETGVSKVALASWALIATGSILNFYFGYYGALLQGQGNVTGANKSVVVSKLVYVLVSVTLLISGAGLLGIGTASLLSVVAGRIVARHAYMAHTSTGELRRLALRSDHRRLLAVLWPNARRLGITNVGAFLILRGNTLIATSVLGLEIAASYGLAVQLLQALTAVANMPMMLQMPRLNGFQFEKNRCGLRESVGTAVFMGLSIYISGALLLILLASPLLSVAGSHTGMLDRSELLLLALIFGLELHHSLFASYLTTLNSVPFVRSALLSGLAICALASFLTIASNLGTMGLVVAQGLVQLAYNNWKWPLEGLRNLGGGWGRLLAVGASKTVEIARGR